MDTLLVDANMRMASCQRDVASSSKFKKIPERLKAGKSSDPACEAYVESGDPEGDIV
jgi:hypothetical protein